MAQCDICNEKANHRISKTVINGVVMYANLCNRHYLMYSRLPDDEKRKIISMLKLKH